MASPPQHNREQALDFMKTNPEYTFLTQNLDSKKYYAWKSRDDIVDDDHLTEYMLEHEPRRFYIDWADYYPLGREVLPLGIWHHAVWTHRNL